MITVFKDDDNKVVEYDDDDGGDVEYYGASYFCMSSNWIRALSYDSDI